MDIVRKSTDQQKHFLQRILTTMANNHNKERFCPRQEDSKARLDFEG